MKPEINIAAEVNSFVEALFRAGIQVVNGDKLSDLLESRSKRGDSWQYSFGYLAYGHNDTEHSPPWPAGIRFIEAPGVFNFYHFARAFEDHGFNISALSSFLWQFVPEQSDDKALAQRMLAARHTRVHGEFTDLFATLEAARDGVLMEPSNGRPS